MSYAEALATGGLEAASDEELLQVAYGARHFDPSAENLAGNGLTLAVWQQRNPVLLEAVRGAEARRAETIRAADDRKRAAQARRAARQGTPARMQCGRCGTEYPTSVMLSGSLRVLCPECYDREEAAL